MENSGKVDISTKELLPHQELRIKSGLEKAIKHKDKLLEFDRTRYDVVRIANANKWTDLHILGIKTLFWNLIPFYSEV